MASIVGADYGRRLPLARMIRWSAVARALDDLGYTSYAFETGSRTADLDKVDIFRGPRSALPTNLERLLLETSSLVLVPQLAATVSDVEGNVSARAHRERILFILSTLPEIATQPGPKFVFAHILSPHPPFVLDQDGVLVDMRLPFSFDDGDGFDGSRQEYTSGYVDQTVFVSKAIIEAIKGILANSARPPVIILQSDHGPGSGLVWDSMEKSDVRERVSILNALLLPDAPTGTLYPPRTPVNTFRLIFNTYFGTDLPMLEDRSYFSTWERPYDFQLIPELRLSTGSPP